MGTGGGAFFHFFRDGTGAGGHGAEGAGTGAGGCGIGGARTGDGHVGWIRGGFAAGCALRGGGNTPSNFCLGGTFPGICEAFSLAAAMRVLDRSAG